MAGNTIVVEISMYNQYFNDFLQVTITDESIVEITGSITSFVSESGNNTEDQSTENLERIAAVFESVNNLLEEDGLTVDTEVWTCLSRRLVDMAVPMTTGNYIHVGIRMAQLVCEQDRSTTSTSFLHIFVYMTFHNRLCSLWCYAIETNTNNVMQQKDEEMMDLLVYCPTFIPMPSFCGLDTAILTFYREIGNFKATEILCLPTANCGTTLGCSLGTN